MSLQNDGPLILSYMVCGSRDAFRQLGSIIIRTSHRDTGGADIIPKPNFSLIRDSNAVAHGITASLLSNQMSPDFETCNEILVRVWTDHPNVVDLQIDLVLGIMVGTRVSNFDGVRHFLFLPDDVTTPATVATTADITTDAATTATTADTTVTTAGRTTTLVLPTLTTASQPPGIGDPSIMLCSSSPVKSVLISAILGSLLLVAMVIIVILVAVMVVTHGRRKGVQSTEEAEPASTVHCEASTVGLY